MDAATPPPLTSSALPQLCAGEGLDAIAPVIGMAQGSIDDNRTGFRGGETAYDSLVGLIAGYSTDGCEVQAAKVWSGQ